MNTEIELWASTETGSIAGVTQCILNGVDIHAKDASTGQTALHKAAVCGHVDIITLLLDQGVSVNEVDNEGFTALHLACGAADEVAVVTVLLSQGHAFIDATDQQGMSPLMVATSAGYVNVVNLLIAKKAYLHLKAHDGKAAVDMTPYGR
jgi:ankyrin repeat protein